MHGPIRPADPVFAPSKINISGWHANDGDKDCDMLGIIVGLKVGTKVGIIVGIKLGRTVGVNIGVVDGIMEGVDVKFIL